MEYLLFLCGVMAKVLDCEIVVCEFNLQSGYYVHYQTNIVGKGIKPSSLHIVIALAFNYPVKMLSHETKKLNSINIAE